MLNLRYAFTMALLCASPVAAAQTTPDMNTNPNSGTGYIGASVLLNSKHLGSADEETRILPYLSFEDMYGFDLFGPTLSYRLIETGTGRGLDKWSLRAGPSLSYRGGRDSADAASLTGFDDIGGSVPLGAYVRSTIGPVGLRLEAAQDIAGGHDGLTIDASVGTFIPLGDLAIQPSATISWGSGKHNERFFGVSDAESTASGLDRFNTGAGLYSVSAGVVSYIVFDDTYAVSLIGNYRWFVDDAANSPILNAPEGSKNGIFVTLGLSRKFDINKWN